MSIAKIIEVVGEGTTMEQAVQNILKEASKSISNIKGVDILKVHAKVENNAIIKYRVDAKVAFVVEKH